MSLSHSFTTCLESGGSAIIYIALGQAMPRWKAESCAAEGRQASCITRPQYVGGWSQERSSAY